MGSFIEGEGATGVSSAEGIIGSDGAGRINVTAGLVLDVRSASGSLTIREGAEGTCAITLSTDDPDPAKRFSRVESSFDQSSNRLVIDTKATPSGGQSLKRLLKGLIDNAHHDVDIDIEVPSGTNVKFRTASGDLSALTALVDLDVTSASGSVTTGDVMGSLKVTSASGSVTAGDVMGSLKFSSASGDVTALNIDGDVEVQLVSGRTNLGAVCGDVAVKSVSGNVSIGVAAPVGATLNTVSGDVLVAVRPGMLVEIDANTLSGKLSSEIALDGAGDSLEGERPLRLRSAPCRAM
jgi:hypothetical protein